MQSEEKLNNFTQSLNEMFLISPFEGVTSISPTGEYYLTLTSSGIKSEGEILEFYPTLDEAITQYIIYFEKYIELINEKIKNSCKLTEKRFEREFQSLYFVKPYTLYWRHRPQIAYEKPDKYYIWSRLLISNKSINTDIVIGFDNGRKSLQQRTQGDK